MRTLLPCLILFLGYLVWERMALDRARRRIPLRIAVTGTRGKSGVVRLLASILTQSGRRVVAKTTGSEAVILLPDGRQVELDRSITPSILEQKQLVHRAAQLHADCLVAEIMSIHPENHYVEAHQILKADIVVITNVRRDHTDAMGNTEEKIASVLSLDVCDRAAVFVPVTANHEQVRLEAQRRNAVLIPVIDGASAPVLQGSELDRLEFGANLDIVCAVAGHLGIDRKSILDGIGKAQHDIGGLRVWRYPDRGLYLVNAFAANDPESTFEVLAKVSGMIPSGLGDIFGILNLRPDRLPRTLQWLGALRNGAGSRFKRLFITGSQARFLQRRLPEARLLRDSPAEITRIVCSEASPGTMIFGFGNVKGPGKQLIDYWSRIGQPYYGGDQT